ncbi:EamA-like transporter family protein [Novosphingobium kunmingense]|uniref:EamA-like transporter family protein n=1 Tax=Novosphingobium kunmingense TaxID=1211806 RepID=A0A2N0H5C3_9SPHN|nr:DMT family transporter [Novosphingobium kunmingense]PKB14129.1 EamA-like transporter family protein [Novosphingobium kunmingense]
MSQAVRVTPRALGAFVLVTLIWGSTWLVIKDQIAVLSPSWAVAYRFTLAALAMFALAAIRGERLRLPAPALGFAGLIGLFQFFGNFQLVYRAEHFITSGLVAVIFALLLVPNTLLARLFIGTQVSARFLAGSAVAIAGIALLIVYEYRAAPAGGTAVLVGIGMTLLAVLSASVSNVMQSARIARENSTLVVIGWAMAFGAAADLVFALATVGPPPLDIGLRGWLGVAYLAILGSVVTFPLYFALIRDWGPGPAAYSSVLIPVVAMALSTLFEGYLWSPLAAGGAVLAMIGLVIALSPARHAPSPST